MNYVGITPYVEDVVRDEPEPEQTRGRVLEDGLLHELSDLIGQAVAYGREAPVASLGILLEARRRVRVLELRYYAAQSAIEHAQELLGLSGE